MSDGPSSDLPHPEVTIGVDLGGTKVAAALLTPEGHLLQHDRRLIHQNADPERVVNDVVAAVRDLRVPVGSRVVSLGVGVAGQVRSEDGTVLFAPNLGWRGFPLGTRLEEILGYPVSVTNDVRAETFGEWRLGAGKGFDDVLCVFIGTGVGGGIVSGGRLLEGATSSAGEVGHSMLIAGGRRCHCPSSGCLEAYVGGWAIAVRAQEAVRLHPDQGQLLLELATGLEAITAETVTEACAKRDPLALAIMSETATWLGLGLAGLVNAFNPARLILGGGIIDHHPDIIDVVHQIVRASAEPPIAEAVTVVPAALGPDAGVIGSALLAHAMNLRSRP
jgi:glucokinase